VIKVWIWINGWYHKIYGMVRQFSHQFSLSLRGSLYHFHFSGCLQLIKIKNTNNHHNLIYILWTCLSLLLFMHECHIIGDKYRETEMIQAKETVYYLLHCFLFETYNQSFSNLIWRQAIVTNLFSILSLLYGIEFGWLTRIYG